MIKLLKYIVLLGVFCFVGYQAIKIYEQEVVKPRTMVKANSEAGMNSLFTNAATPRENNSLGNNTQLETGDPNSKQYRQAKSLNIFGGIGIMVLLVTVLWLVKNNKKRKEENKRISDELADSQEKLRYSYHELKLERNYRKQSQESLKNALETLKDANSLKDAFLSNISHEVRTPLNGIIGFTTLTGEEARKLGNSKIENFSRIVLSSSDRLLNFLNNVIDLSRIEARELNIKTEHCDLVEITKHTIASLGFVANEKALNVIVELDGFVPVLANYKYLSQVIRNILDNAIKYTEEGFVRVSLSNPVGNNDVTLCVEDSGIGIKPGFIDRIFEAFNQESTGMTRSFEGGGLALPLSKKLIEMMGGQIEIQSEKGKGTMVKIHLNKPATSYNDETIRLLSEKRMSLSSGQSGQSKTIFLIEDDSINGELIEAYLLGFAHVIVTKSGNEALLKLEKLNSENKSVDLFLMDINLPQDWDGTTLMNEIKNRWQLYSETPFIAQTAYAMKGDREKLLNEGFNDYISKPIKKTDLIKCINNQLVNQLMLHKITA
ncbi:MAG: response regulator [Bacteroidales bacterium]|nr:response regulator [Bacteroidales bacterium]MCF8457357.1 response regulator [Bacteroidales bacterium]